jgi:hypothetical protein
MKRYVCAPFGATRKTAGEQTVRRKANIMGDKSPKAVSKHATQKQTKANSDLQKRQQSIAAKQVAGKKK